MIPKIALVVIMVLILLTISAGADSLEKEVTAAIAAEKWLGLVDVEKYAESWKEAAELFRNAVKQEQWEQLLRASRKPLGRLVSRKIKTKAYTTSLPGVPDGEYVVIQFESSFENKKSAVAKTLGDGYVCRGYFPVMKNADGECSNPICGGGG